MIPFIHRWVYEDIYVPVWPNWVAGIIASGALYFWKGRAWLKRHREHERKITEIHNHLGLNNDKR